MRLYSQDIRIEFGIEKCAMFVRKSSKRHMTEGIELPNIVVIRTLGKKETYLYLGILETSGNEEIFLKEYFRRTRK